MTHPEISVRTRGIVREKVGAVFANPVFEPMVTCEVCAAPSEGYARCYPCSRRQHPGLAKRIGVMAYAVRGQQSGFLMRTYKAASADTTVQDPLRVLLATGVLHSACLAEAAGSPPDCWVSVPSLPAKPGIHPLRQLMLERTDLPGFEVAVRAGSSASAPRNFDPRHFIVDGDPAGCHVLVLDDTWTSGGHAQSLAAALWNAGATQVSVLVLARWIEPTFRDNQSFVDQRILGTEFDPHVCPWRQQ